MKPQERIVAGYSISPDISINLNTKNQNIEYSSFFLSDDFFAFRASETSGMKRSSSDL